MEAKPDSFIPTRESLLSRLKDLEDQASWRDFFHLYRQLICGLARRAGLTEQETEDVLQETLITVANTIHKFEYDPKRCRFKSWLGHLTQKRIADCYRQRARQRLEIPLRRDETSLTPLLERVADPGSLDLEGMWEQEWQQKLLEAAIQNIKSQVNAEQYQIFDFYVLRKMPVRQVSDALGVSIGQIYLAKHRVTGLIRKEVKRLERKMG